MRIYQSNEIGNVVVLGHAGCGKTSVIEAMLYRAGGSNRIGKISDGSTTSDYDIEEMKRKFLSTEQLSLWNGKIVRLIS